MKDFSVRANRKNPTYQLNGKAFKKLGSLAFSLSILLPLSACRDDHSLEGEAAYIPPENDCYIETTLGEAAVIQHEDNLSNVPLAGKVALPPEGRQGSTR